jgi:RNase P subunit RPR2
VNTRKIAEERINILFKKAEEKKEKNLKLSNRYVKLACRIGERTQTSIPRKHKKKYCSNCKTYWIQGKNCQTRIDSKNNTINYKCLNCGEKTSYGY